MKHSPPLSPTPLASACYRFCDVGLVVSASRAETLERFDSLHVASRQTRPAGGQREVRCFIRTDSSGRGQVVVGGLERSIEVADPDGAYAFALVMDAVAAASRSHLFLHAAAVSVGDRTALLVGPSGAGKTTLARALVDRGAVCLADDVTPIDSSTGALSPLPPVGARGRTAPLDAPHHAFLLGPVSKADRVHLAVDRFPDEWGTTPPWGSAPATVRPREGYWEIEVEAVEPSALGVLTRACREAGVLVLRDLGQPASQFAAATSVHPLEPAEGLPLLALHVFGRGSRDAVQLVWDLGGALGQASLWRLLPGPPDEAAQVVSAILRAPLEHSPASQ